MTGLWAQYREELGSDPFLVLALSAALLAIATTPLVFAVLGRLQTQLQLLSLSFAVKMLVGLGFLAAALRFFPGVFEKAGAVTFAALLRLLTH